MSETMTGAILMAGRMIEDVKKDFAERLKPYLEEADYFNSWAFRDRHFPPSTAYLRPAIYVVQGGSEGWYVHFDFLDIRGSKALEPSGNPLELDDEFGFRTMPIMLAKFWKIDQALAFSNALTRLVWDCLDAVR